jgi:hypothetical protein
MSDRQHEAAGSKSSPLSSSIQKRSRNEQLDNDQESQSTTTDRQVSFCDSIQYIPRRDDVRLPSLPHRFEEDNDKSQCALLEPNLDPFDRRAAIYFGNRCQEFKFEDLPFVPDYAFGDDVNDDDFDAGEEELSGAHHSRAEDSKKFSDESTRPEDFDADKIQEHQSEVKICSNDDDKTTRIVGRRTVRYGSWCAVFGKSSGIFRSLGCLGRGKSRRVTLASCETLRQRSPHASAAR